MSATENEWHLGVLQTELHNITDGQVIEHHTKESGHGRLDQRSYYICGVPVDLADKERWKNLAAIGISINNTKRRKGDEIAVRYYILSKQLSGKEFAGAVRDHSILNHFCSTRGELVQEFEGQVEPHWITR